MATIIYIGGYGRSGSTVLDIALGNDAGVISLGEVANLFPLLASAGEAVCSCDEAVHNCPLWGPVIRSLQEAGLNDWRRIARAQRVVEGWRGFLAAITGHRALWGFTGDAAETYVRYMRALFAALATTSGAPVFVDSSKSTRLTLSRALALQQLCRFDVRFIHLVRDGRAVMWSGATGSNKQLASGPPDVSALRGYKTALSWNATNLLTALISRRFKKRQLVLYEDFVAFPDKTVAELSKRLQLDLAQLQHKLKSRQALRVNHLIAGNRVVREQTISLQVVHDWQEALSIFNRLMFLLLAWPAALFVSRKSGAEKTKTLSAAKVGH